MTPIILTCLKWLGLILCALALASYLTSKTFRAEIFIMASPQTVWKTLMDTTSYPEWNPVFVEVEGSYKQDATVINHVKDQKDQIITMKAKVLTLYPGKELRQKTGLPLILTADHRWTIEPHNGGTRVVQYEIDRGMGLWFWNSDWVEPAYNRVNLALKKRLVADLTP